MDKKYVRTKAQNFLCELKGKRVSMQTISEALRARGWEIVRYNDGGPGDRLIQAYGLKSSLRYQTAFCYTSQDANFIALDSYAPKPLESLLHEAGHIFLEHVRQGEAITVLSGEDHAAADYFANCLSHKNNRKRLFRVLYPAAAAILLAVVSIACCTVAANKPVDTAAPSPSGQVFSPASSETISGIIKEDSDKEAAIDKRIVYITASGERYHLETCQYVKNNNTAGSLTIEEAREEGKSPCKKCRPDEFWEEEK